MCEAGMCEVQQTAQRCMLGAVLGFEPVKRLYCSLIVRGVVVLLKYCFQISHTVNFTANCIVLLHCFCMYGTITHPASCNT